jgi:hypothetical protein
MRKTVFLHIGATKSGSTYLHAHMWANRDELRAHGIHLPGHGWIDHYLAGADLRAMPRPNGHARRAGAWERLVAEVHDAEGCAAIIADERLARASSSQVHRAVQSLAPHDVRVIYSVREFAGLLTSAWQQSIKAMSPRPLEEWLTRVAGGDSRWFWEAHHLGSVFARWNLPRDRMNLLIVPATPADPEELWRRFASIVGAPVVLPHRSPPRNQSLGLDETELVRRIFRHLNGRPPPFRSQWVMRQVVSRQVLSPRPNSRRIQLPEACRQFVIHQTMRRKMFVASSGCRVIGDVDELDVDPTRFVPELVRPEEAHILDAALDVIGELTIRIARQRHSRGGRPDSSSAPRQPAANHKMAAAPRTRSALREIGRSTRVALANWTGRSYYLHIGPHAAGSRSLQRLLWANHAPLLAAGVYLPGTSQRDHDAAWPPTERSAAWERLIGDAERSGHRRILITNEALATAGQKEIGRLLHRLDGADIHVIYVLRDVLTLLVAAWQREARLYPTSTWPEWLTGLIEDAPVGMWRAHDVTAVLDRWHQGGASHVHLLVYPGSAGPSVLWDRFRAIVGWKAEAQIDHASNVDRLLDPAAAEVVRRARERIGGGRPRYGLARVIEDLLLGRDRTFSADPALAIPAGVRPWVEAQSAARRSCTAGARYEVIGDAEEFGLTDAHFAPSAQLPNDAATLDAATRIAATLAGELADLRWPGRTNATNAGWGA